MDNMRIMVARLFMIGALAAGVIGLLIGLIEKEWRLGLTGWFTGGTLLAILALVVLADEYFARRSSGA